MISLSLDSSEIEILKAYIEKHKLYQEPVKSEYELLRIKDKDINIIVYKSGKVVYIDNHASRRIMGAVLQKEENYDFILGSDETGKGEWYGPLVVVGTALTPEDILELRKMGVRDSKTIKKSSLMKLAPKIMNMGFIRQSVVITPETYNQLYREFSKEKKSLNDLLAWAHSAEIKDLLKRIEFHNAKVVIDRFDSAKMGYRLENIDKANLEVIQKPGGESEIPVAAASIIAKYLFEKEVDKLDHKYALDLRNYKPEDIEPDLLPRVAKIHFKNVARALKLSKY
jgi:ribonuclease HIII